VSLILLKWLEAPWEHAREYLRQDLESIQTVYNRQISQLVDSGGGGGASTTLIQQTITGAGLVVPLGGSDRDRIPITTPNQYEDVVSYYPYPALTSFQGRVRVWVWTLNRTPDSTAKVRAVLYNESTGVRVASTLKTALTRTAGLETFDVAITAGMTYRLQATCDTADVWPFCIGQLEAVA
jgi:hypothetical protein